MAHRGFLFRFPGGKFPALAGMLAAGAWAQTRPNIVFLFTDDHAAQSIPAYGGLLKDVAKTPNLDRLAREGMRFDRAYVTNALCGPSRAVVQTGKYSHKNGFRTNTDTFDGSQQTFPKLLRARGYQTAVIGKWHLVSDPQGFDYWDVLPDQGAYYNPDLIRGDSTGRKQARKVGGSNSAIIGDLSLDWLQNGRDKAKPFLLMCQFKATHRDWQPGPDYVGMFKGVKIPEPGNLLDDYRYRGSAAHFQEMTIRNSMNQNDLKLTTPGGFAGWTAAQQGKWSAYYDPVKQDFASRGFVFTNRQDTAMLRWKYQRYMEDYLSVAFEMDKHVGRLLDYLDQSGLAGNTVVIYSSDQGFFLGEHGWFDKRFMFEESLRTPLLVRWPGVTAAGSVNREDLVSNLDFPETFLELAGAPVPADMQGASLVPILKGKTPANWRKSHYYHYYEGPPAEHKVYRHYGVTTGRYKLIYFHDVDEWEFYDLKKDPGEMINQYYIPGNAARIAELKAELARQRAQLQVPADPAPAPGLRTVTLEKWLSPLPVKGCMDPRYAEYDPEATESLPGACRVPTAARPAGEGRADGMGNLSVTYLRGAGRVRFEASQDRGRETRPAGGGTRFSIHQVNGSLLEDLEERDGAFEWDVSDVRPGVYVAELRRDGRVEYLKLRI